MVKGRLGADSAACAVAFKSWSNPSIAVAACAEVRRSDLKPRFGLTLQLENFGALRFERADDREAKGLGLTQRHEATDVDMASLTGRRPLVVKSARHKDFNVQESPTSGLL